MKADKYYGVTARDYDASRCHSLRWSREQLAVDEMVTAGPVLDVPIGTGRYIGIYRAKGLAFAGVDLSADMMAEAARRYGTIDTRRGDVRALPFEAGSFATAVCTRLLDWLAPADMAAAVGELRRVAQTLVVTIRTGTPGCRINWTHDLSAFYRAIGGLHIEARRWTETTQDGVEEMFKLRPPTWADVIEQFKYESCDPLGDVRRIASEWDGRLWPHMLDIRPETVTVRAEYWSTADLAAVIDEMAGLVDHLDRPHGRYITDELPRYPGGPVTVMQANGKCAVLDGRRRINRWRREATDDELHPVLFLECAQ